MAANPAPPLYLPVPHWTLREAWEPIYEPSGERLAWPAGFDPARLPAPRHAVRERVTFIWRGRRRRGEIRDIKLGGGPYTPADDLPALIEARYLRRPPEYVIYTSGHGFWVPETEVE